MRKSGKILSLLLAFAMMLSLGCVSFAANNDWGEYQDYIYAYAEAGAPNPEDAVEMADAIYACEDMDDIKAASNIQVFFDVLGALDFDEWIAAGKPEADISAGGGSGEPSGEASGEAGDNAVISVEPGEIVYVSGGEEKTAAVGEGQTAYLSVDGVNVPLEEGEYAGSVEIDVVDPILADPDYETGDKDVQMSTEMAAVVYITDEGLQEVQSILSAAKGGEITDTKVSGVTINSDVAAVSGIRSGGSAEIEVEDVTINLNGEGGNDFMGQGTALCATDGSTLVARNVTANVSGYVRGCTFAGGSATLEVYDSTFNCDAGDYNEEASVEMAGMSQPPKGLGVFGNARSNNLIHNATQYFENCVFNNRNWGCLGVDAVTDGHLTCKNCEINVTECGYGAYSIGPCVDTFQNCRFNVHNGVIAFAAVEGTVILEDGTVANSDRYGLVTHQAMGAVSTLKVLGEGTELNSAYCGIMVKGRSSDIEIGDGAVVTASETGIVLEAQDNDDLGAGAVNPSAEITVNVHDTALEGDFVMAMAPASEGDTATMSITLTNATVDGAITLANAELAIPDGAITIDNILSVGRVENEYANRTDGCRLVLDLEDGAVWNVTETSYLTELNVADGAVVNGTVTECDGYVMVEPAEGAAAASDGVITLRVDGEEVSSFAVPASVTDKGFALDLSGALDALGLEMSYDEASTTVTLKDNSGILASLLKLDSEPAGEGIYSVACGEPYDGRPAPEVIEGKRYVGDRLRGGSAIYVSGGEYTFDDIYVYGAGFSSDEDTSAERSSQYGYCSDVLATSPESVVTLNNPTIESDPESYANGVFATNQAKIYVNGGVINTNNPQGHGLDVTYMGHIYADGTVIHTGGSSSGALATDYGGGFLSVQNLDCVTEMGGSPGIYCAGSSIIMAKDSKFVANNCEGVMSAHDHGVTVLDNCYTYGETSALNGHQAMPSAAMSTGSYCFVFGGTLESGSGPVFKEENGRTEEFVVGAELIKGADYPYAVECKDDNAGILTLNLWDCELVGDVYCPAGQFLTVNLYEGAKLVGEVVGDGDVTINVFDGGEYEGSFEATEAGEGLPAPECGDFDYYLVNYWAAGMQKWQTGTITKYVEEVEPQIIESSAVSFVEEGAASIAYDPATSDLSENGIDLSTLDTSSALGFGDPGDGFMGLTSGEPS